MQKFFRKVFGIYPGEGLTTLRFALFSIFWAFSSMTLENLSDGLFLKNVGADFLPRVYLLEASILIIASSLIVYSLRIVSPYRILVTVMSGGLFFSFLAIVMLSSSPPFWFYFALKIFTRLFFSIFLACAWTFIDQHHDLHDAKRIYSLYSAAYFLGIVISGFTINLFLDKWGHQTFFSIVCVTILLAIWGVRTIAHKIPAIHDDTIEGIFSGDRHGFSAMVKLIIKSPFTIALLALSLGQQFLLIITEFNYLQTLENTFQNAQVADSFTAQNISEFLGKCRGWISAGNIIVGAFIYPPILRRAGLNNAILITPIFFLCVYSGWVIHDSLWIAIFGLIAVDGILFTIEDNSFNLLTKAVHPKLKSKVRIINDSFFEPVGMLFCSLLLFLMEKQSHVLGFVFAAITLLITFILRSYYSKAIFTSLKEHAFQFERKTRDWLRKMGKREYKETKKDILEALENPSHTIKVTACQALLSLDDSSVIHSILQVAKRVDPHHKIKLIHLLSSSSFAEDPKVVELINQWFTSTQDMKLKRAAHFFLAKRGLLHPDKVIDDLDSTDLSSRGAAIITLTNSLAPRKLEQLSLHRTIAQNETDLMLKSNDTKEICMGLTVLREAHGSHLAEKALPLLFHEALNVRRESATTLSIIADKSLSRYSHKLIEALDDSFDHIIRQGCLTALGKIGNSTTVKDIILASVHFRPQERRLTEEIITRMGLKTVPILLSIMKDTALHDRCRILAGKILASLSLPQLQANLNEILNEEIERAFFYFHFGHTIQKKYPLYDLNLLQEALLTSFQSVIDFIIHLLGAAGSVEDCELLVHSLRSKNEKMHSNALETLEKRCNGPMFRKLFPLIDDMPLEEKIEASEKVMKDHKDLTLAQLLERLDQSPALFDKVVAAQLKAALQMPNWRKSLKQQIKECDETFHHFAYELLKL